MSQAIHAHALGQGLLGLGMVLMGFAWFMRPLPLGARISPSAQGVGLSAGRNSLRKGLTVAAFALMVVGLTLRIAGAM